MFYFCDQRIFKTFSKHSRAQSETERSIRMSLHYRWRFTYIKDQDGEYNNTGKAFIEDSELARSKIIQDQHSTFNT